MRLNSFERESIKNAFYEVFGSGRIYLFGSRVDDTKRGGDIDLYLYPDKIGEDMYQKKIKFLVELDKTIGEQKIDVVIAKDKSRFIEQVALRDGILL